ncbi:MAG: tripartite tricarboxylate transporter permease [Acidobacteria bacterium]|nr:tripartite tricarboxylate transporter permease [Acidobacteriota bacterium]
MIGALQTVLDPGVLLVVVLSAVYGVFIGSIPGLTATMAVALLVPVTFHLDAVHAIAAVVTLVACAIFAGDIPNTLLRIPGTPASAAYTDEVHAFTRRGLQDRALGVCLVFSVAGGLLGALVLMLFAQSLARVATLFGTVEYFWLYLLGLGCAVVATRGSPLRAALGLIVGLGLSTVGLSTAHGSERFTFGIAELYRGINFIPAMIGLFGLSEVLRNLLVLDRAEGPAPEPEPTRRGLGPVFGDALPQLWRRKAATLRSAAIGASVGMLPGAGADIAAWVSLGVSRRLSPNSGDGSLDSVGDATAANNSALSGAWVPTLVFGIPGDSVTALVIGILMMKDVTPGADIFVRDGGALVYSIYLLFFLANLVLLPVGFLAIKAGGALVRVPHRILLPVIVLFCVIGAYAANNSYFDVGVMLAMGLLGFTLDAWRVPLGPVVLGIVLGGPLEERFIGTLNTSGGSPLAFFERPQSLALSVLCVALWLAPALSALRRRRRA